MRGIADNLRSAMVCDVLASAGWSRDIFAAGTVGEYHDRYKMAVVDDGVSDRGRGTTLLDLTRKVAGPSLVRTDFMSVKAAKIEKTGKLPSRVSLGTGNEDTIQAIVGSAMGGSAIPSLVWASAQTEIGPSESGYALFLDLGSIIAKEGLAPLTTEPYQRGKAPAVYIALSARRITGADKRAVARFEREGIPLPEGKWMDRSVGFIPHFDDRGRYWSSPYAVHYSELRVSLSAIGVTRDSWSPMNISDLPRFVDSQGWDAMSF